MLEPIPGMYRGLGRWPKMAEPTASTATTLRRLADLAPRTLALMHGPAFVGDCARTLRELADAYEARFRATFEQDAAA